MFFPRRDRRERAAAARRLRSPRAGTRTRREEWMRHPRYPMPRRKAPLRSRRRPRRCRERSGVRRPVEELLAHDLAVLHGVERHLLHVVPLTGGLEGDVEVVIDREFVVVADEGPINGG